MTPFIETFTGKTFQPLAPIWRDIDLRDIAHALSNQCRFSGHVRAFYSVAEHSVRVANLLEFRGEDHQTCLWGLLHDASEAYLIDLPTPLKHHPTLGPAYQKAERRMMRAVCQRFTLPWREPLAVKRADADLLATEVRDLMHGDRHYWQKLKGKAQAGIEITGWIPNRAEYEFRYAFRKFGGV